MRPLVLTVLMVGFLLPTSAASAGPSEFEIIQPFLAQFDLPEVGGDHCKRYGGSSSSFMVAGVPFQLPDYPATNTYLEHHRKYHDEADAAINADDFANETSDYGTLFRDFHQEMLIEYETWRAARSMAPVPVWDPSTPVPSEFQYPATLPVETMDELLRRAPPYLPTAACISHVSNDPRVELPSWATIRGGDAADPLFGLRSLCGFETINQLGKSLNAAPDGYHGAVHNAVGGDLAPSVISPRDPLFWPWHKFLEVEVFQAWETECESEPVVARTAEDQAAVPGVEALSSLVILVVCGIFIRRNCAR